MPQTPIKSHQQCKYQHIKKLFVLKSYTHKTISITPESIVFADFQKIFWVFWNNSTNKIECAEFTNCSEPMSSQQYVAHGQFRNRALNMDKTKHD